MASEVSKLIDDELQKEGRDETTRLLPGQGVKARLVLACIVELIATHLRESTDPPIGDGRCLLLEGHLSVCRWSGPLASADTLLRSMHGV